MSKRGKRRRWTSSEKLRIVLTGMESGVEVSELCRREEMYAIRRHKLAQARHRRREKNLQLRQPTLPLSVRRLLLN